MKEQEKTDVQNAEVTSNAQKEFPTYDKDFFEQEVKRFLEQHQKELQCLDTMKISNNTKRLIECSYQVNLLCNEISGFLYHYYGDKEGDNQMDKHIDLFSNLSDYIMELITLNIRQNLGEVFAKEI